MNIFRSFVENFSNMVKHRETPINSPSEKETDGHDLILFNDDINTFDFVIDALVDICRHETAQAEQCALIAHLKGKCPVKHGGYFELKPMYEALTLRGLTVSVD